MHCGGSIINKKFILTAAHCFQGGELSDNPKDYKVVVGGVDLASPEPLKREYFLSKIITHKSFVPAEDASEEIGLVAYDNDIALLAVRGQIMYNRHTKPVCLDLVEQHQFTDEEALCKVSGWGYLQEDAIKTSRKLQFAIMPLASKKSCDGFASKHWISLTENMFCSGHGESGKAIDACNGDSGGPLSCVHRSLRRRYKQVGIVSFGQGCARRGTYGVFTKISNYKKWIVETMDEF